MARKSVTDRLVAINVALEKIGNVNGQAAPASQDPLDAILHEYDAACIGESYFKKRREKAKAAMLKHVSDEGVDRLAKAIKRTKDLQQGETLALIESQHFTLNCTLKNGASFVDVTKLCNELKKKIDPAIVEEALAKAQDRREPAQSYTVAARDAE